MRVLLTHAYCWPYVRRGTERNIEVWYRYLARSGYEARVLATLPPGAAPPSDPNKLLRPQSWLPWMRRFRLTPAHTFLWDAWRAIPQIETDVIHSYYFYDSLAAAWRRRGRKYGTVLQLNGIPVPGVSCRRFLPPEAPLMRLAVHEADRCIVCSEFVREMLREHMRGDAIVIPPPVDPEIWPVGAGPRADPPVILAVGNFDERRKGIRSLARAFEFLRLEGREARLRISGTVNEALRSELVSSVKTEVSPDIEFLGIGRAEDLSALYQTASVLALPAMWEPSGTVMMEAWLSGTPSVAARHGGLPEFFADGTGFLFDPETDAEETNNVRGLAEALDRAIIAAKLPETRARCREHGETFSPAVLGPRFTDVYKQVTHGRAF